MSKLHYSLLFSRIFISLITLIFTFTAQAEIYKWVDENGKVHYSDKPFDKNSKKIEVKREPTQAERLEAQKRASKMIRRQNKVHAINEQEARDKKVLAQKEEVNRKQRAQACAEAKRLILVYSGRGAIYSTDKNGKKTYKGYTDEQKNQKIAQLQQGIKENCNNSKSD